MNQPAIVAIDTEVLEGIATELARLTHGDDCQATAIETHSSCLAVVTSWRADPRDYGSAVLETVGPTVEVALCRLIVELTMELRTFVESVNTLDPRTA